MDNSGIDMFGAIEGHRLDIVQELLNSGVSANGSINGEYPLYAATRHNFVDGVKLLLDNAADPNSTNNDGMTPLHCAVSKNPAIVDLLIKAGADCNIRDDMGKTPLCHIMRDSYLIKNDFRRVENICNKLLEGGANPYLEADKDYLNNVLKGETPFSKAPDEIKVVFNAFEANELEKSVAPLMTKLPPQMRSSSEVGAKVDDKKPEVKTQSRGRSRL